MARIRSVKPSLRTSRVVASWPMEVRYFWVLLWGYLDDEGRGLDIPKAIAGDCFPLDDKVTPAKVDGWLRRIATSKIGDKQPPLCRYEVAGIRYIHSVNWDDNQRPNRPSPSAHPPCPLHEPLTESPLSPQVLEGGEGEVGGGRAWAEPISELPPPSWCKRHPGGTDDPCRACQRAREAHEAWQAAKRARVDATPRCLTHPDQLAANCAPCRSERLAEGAA